MLDIKADGTARGIEWSVADLPAVVEDGAVIGANVKIGDARYRNVFVFDEVARHVLPW